jgi:ubiquinone/menaquinone biosynthesis C-methylase UbiE
MSDMRHSETPESRPSSLMSDPPSLLILPRTVARRVAELVTGRGEAELYRRAIELLALQLEDVVLEVGCGAGHGVEQAAAIAALGRVYGIELSEELLAAARVRNADAIRDGYVELNQGTSSKLPWADATFTAAFSVNSPRDWPQPVANLAEMRRVVRSDGRLALVVQAPWRTSRDGVRDLAELWAHRVDEAGFHEVRFGILNVGRGGVAAITGTA